MHTRAHTHTHSHAHTHTQAADLRPVFSILVTAASTARSVLAARLGGWATAGAAGVLGAGAGWVEVERVRELLVQR